MPELYCLTYGATDTGTIATLRKVTVVRETASFYEIQVQVCKQRIKKEDIGVIESLSLVLPLYKVFLTDKSQVDGYAQQMQERAKTMLLVR